MSETQKGMITNGILRVYYQKIKAQKD